MVLGDVVGDGLAEFRAVDIGGAEVDTSPDACLDDFRGRLGEVAEIPSGAGVGAEPSKAMSSLPKKDAYAAILAPVPQVLPDG